MKKLLFSFLILFTITTHVTHADEALKEAVQKYPPAQWLIGIGTEKSLETAKAEATAEISKRLVDPIKKSIDSNRSALEYKNVVEHYSPLLHSPIMLPLSGLHYAVIRSFPQYTVLAYAKRADFKAFYANRAEKIRKEIANELQKAERAYTRVDYDADKATQKYLRTYPRYETLKVAEVIQLGADYNPNHNYIFSKLAEYAVGGISASNPPLRSQTEVVKEVEEFRKPRIDSLETIAKEASQQLLVQVPYLSDKVQLDPFTYAGLLSSPASSELQRFLAKELGWTFLEKSRAIGRAIGEEIEKRAPWRLYGTLWQEGDGAKFRTILRNVETGEFKAGGIVQFSMTRIAPPITLKPPGHEDAKEVLHAFRLKPPGHEDAEESDSGNQSQLHILHQTTKGLVVEVRTNKGRPSGGVVTYTEGEKVEFEVKVNQESYVRLLYLLDGSYTPRVTLLYDNYHIDKSHINNWVKIPGNFVCMPPFGVEHLVVVARPHKFDSIDTYKKDGLLYLQNQDLKQLGLEMHRAVGLENQGTDQTDQIQTLIIQTGPE